MTVNQILMSLGEWNITFSTNMPRDTLDAIDYFGHVAVLSGRMDPRQYGDSLLTAARYVGVLRLRDVEDSGIKLSGASMVLWLGDQDDKGAVIETAIDLEGVTFPAAVRALLPAAVTEGTLHSVPGTYTQRHQWQTPKAAIEYALSTFGNGGTGASAVEYRVNGDATLDAGYVADLYVTTPTCIITPSSAAGYDLAMRGIAGTFGVSRDAQDYTTRVVLMGEGSGITIVTGTADIGTNPYADLHGNPVRMTRIISESDTPASSASSRAQLQLAQFTGTNDQVTLSTSEYDITGLNGGPGTFAAGDMVYVWDPDAGLVDTANEVTFGGQRINPIMLRVMETTWPVVEGMTVAYRAKNGTWTDLTDYVVWETGATSVKVGAANRQLVGSGFEPVSFRPAVDTSIPGQPTLVTPFSTQAYLDNRGFTRAKMIVGWSAPLNTDGSTILDGDHYEIRYAVDAHVIYPATWSQVSQIRWEDMQTWAQPFASPTGQWQTQYAPWGDSSVLLQDLSPGVGYDVQIRAVDTSGNVSAWSGTVTAVAQGDNIPPSTPDAPTVAASRIAVQVTHDLGHASGGTYNLENDLDHLDIHVSTEPTFTPDETTRVGRLKATGGMIAAQLPAVGTFTLESTDSAWVKVVAVDIAGNASNASTAASATALLIDDAHISDLTVSKITAGVIAADWIVGARIKTADSGARVELSSAGLLAFNAAGNQTVSVSAGDGSVSIVGHLATGTSSNRIELAPPGLLQFITPVGTTQVQGLWSTDSTGIRITADGSAFGADVDVSFTMFPPNCELKSDASDGTAQSSVVTSLQADGSGHLSGQVTLMATSSGDPDSALIAMVAAGGLVLPDLTANPGVAGTRVLYTVNGTSLRWKDAAGTVHVLV